ncbi:MAG: MBL fold metallo-hydrolase [Ekhidna sp.]
MTITYIRNATFKIKYGGSTLLVDPMLCEARSIDPFIPGLEKNPIDELPFSVQEILGEVEAVLVTHTHPDHFDSVATKSIDKKHLIICPTEDEAYYLNKGFRNLLAIENTTNWNDIAFTRIEGQHGSGPVLKYMGMVSGFVLKTKNEPTVFIVSDSILTDEVKSAIEKHQPEIIIINPGGGIIPGFESTTVHMDEKQVLEMFRISPESKVIAMHLDSIDFCTVTRKSLKDFAIDNDISEEQLIIPDNGNTVEF